MSALAGSDMAPALSAGDRMRLQSLCDVIEANLRRGWSLDELAKEAGLSKRTLNAKFRTAFGMTVFDYLQHRRFEFARDALVHQRLTVSQAAYRVGYESPANFATAFRRHFGISAQPISQAKPRTLDLLQADRRERDCGDDCHRRKQISRVRKSLHDPRCHRPC